MAEKDFAKEKGIVRFVCFFGIGGDLGVWIEGGRGKAFLSFIIRQKGF
jgi:hypothetical protein